LVAAFGSLRTERLVPERFRRIPTGDPAPPVLEVAAAG
jgi:hypothetical protein